MGLIRRAVGWVMVFAICLVMIVMEEAGWRGYMLPRLLLAFDNDIILSGLVLGFAWGLWHLPIFFWDEYPLSVQGLAEAEKNLQEANPLERDAAGIHESACEPKRKEGKGERAYGDASFQEGLSIFLFYCLGLSGVSCIISLYCLDITHQSGVPPKKDIVASLVSYEGGFTAVGLAAHASFNASMFACGLKRLNSTLLFVFLISLPIVIYFA